MDAVSFTVRSDDQRDRNWQKLLLPVSTGLNHFWQQHGNPGFAV